MDLLKRARESENQHISVRFYSTSVFPSREGGERGLVTSGWHWKLPGHPHDRQGHAQKAILT